jgi:molybdopterin converting factor subunit 1
MRVTVRLFARLREAAGEAAWTVELPADATVADVWQAVVDLHEALAPFGGSISAAVNADFARMSAPVHDGDEVAFLPPVSGGLAKGTRETSETREQR